MSAPLLSPEIIGVVEAAADGAVAEAEAVQELWSGYGHIVRCRIDGGPYSSVIVKHIRWPGDREHPRGWSTDRSHERKVQSYRVESVWYDRYAERCSDECRVPRRLAIDSGDRGALLVLEDLDAAGFDRRHDVVDDEAFDACLRWLARFHARFLGERPAGLWPVGTYWHLATRPDEYHAMPEGAVKRAAAAIDRRLGAARFTTLVHGDAKLANFCFDESAGRVAAVDFQYVGGGCGMKDLAYFVSSCFGEAECERREPELLDRYFELLRNALPGDGVDADAVEEEWRVLYPLAWADFTRFLLGWSPGHWKLHGYSERMTRRALASLAEGDAT